MYYLGKQKQQDLYIHAQIQQGDSKVSKGWGKTVILADIIKVCISCDESTNISTNFVLLFWW